MKIKISDVMNGWKNYLDKSEVVEAIALQRAKKCLECPNFEKTLILTFINETKELKEIEGGRCGICKCPTSALIRSENKKCSDDPPRW